MNVDQPTEMGFDEWWAETLDFLVRRGFSHFSVDTTGYFAFWGFIR